jgi:cytochrome c oxidase subunit 2
MKRLLILTIIALFALTLSACSSEQEEASNAKMDKSIVETADTKDAPIVRFTATNWEWDQEVYTVKANEPVTLELDNKSGYHGVDIVGTGVTVMMDKPQTVTFNKVGTYEIRCSVICGTGHAEMTAKFVVE